MNSHRLELAAGLIKAEEVDGLLRARGIPYGQAARFGSPHLVSSFSDVKDCRLRGSICPQRPSRLDWVTGRVTDGLQTSEDGCLVLTVTACADASNAPVLVWFHGGAYMAGTGEAAKYDAGDLARQGGVVVVTVSYRLGIFGYLNLNGDDDNLGLRDQLLALRWVRENISAFGGNPENVTIAGQSAGGDAVYSLLLCEGSKGLFRRAILQSAPLGVLTTDVRYGVAW